MSVKIGYPSGFWGDEFQAPRRMLKEAPEIDYLAMDYLAEVTMAILKQQQLADSSQGYARDFPKLVDEIVDELAATNTKLLANAGGVNPDGCRRVVEDIAATADVDLTVAAVTGDDILDHVAALREEGVSFRNDDTGAAFETIQEDLVVANAYLGAFPLAEALERGADIVITGRCVDAATAMAPMIHEFDWAPDQYDRLASGLTAGHLLECGTQVTGGVLLDGWRHVDFDEMGYPIVEMQSNGDFVMTKPDDTGGEVTENTVSQQLVYEISNPAEYTSPDVVADFTEPTIEAIGSDRVSVTGCRGSRPPDSMKVSALYEDGYNAQLVLVYSWPDALEKARRADSIIRNRVAGCDLADIRTEFLGFDGCHGHLAEEPEDPNEIVLRIAVHADTESAIDEFGRRALPVGISGPPNVAPVISGRPTPSPVLSFWPCIVPKTAVRPEITISSSGGVGR